MTMKLLPIVADILLFYFFFGHSLLRRVLPPKARAKLEIRDLEKHLRAILRRDRDILTSAPKQALREAIDRVRAARAAGDQDAITDCLHDYRDGAVDLGLPPAKSPWLRENLEILVVALGLAFGIRALFLQPFKIPTGSMQPTLYGIHFIQGGNSIRQNPVARFFQYLHHSRRFARITAHEDGLLDLSELRPARSIPFFPATVLTYGGQRYRLPGTPKTVAKYLSASHPEAQGGVIHLSQGEPLVQGYLELGDHLFVDRTRYCFAEPKRGDIMVFLTDGVRHPQGGALRGRYYIKRLVGLPGDTLRIRNRKLEVKPKGATEFRVVDGEDSPAFGRIYSHKGGYHGYAHMRSTYLFSSTEEMAIPDDRYVVLGDNSENSLDSRFLGTIPRKNIVGRACWVWWPFTRRWGMVDSTEPLDIDTPPKYPQR